MKTNNMKTLKQKYKNTKTRRSNMKLIYAKLGNKNQLLAPFGALCYFLMPSLSLQPMSSRIFSC